ncbi:MAG TPA: hypothetical protein ENJ19_10355 [Gammaproteobacteria bacterium]|nr:hypothetical protein [Gammaproteobacteria bacterium]
MPAEPPRDDERPLASMETERRLRETFPIDTPPDEFAARDGLGWLNFPFAHYRYRDEELDRWIQAVGGILRNPKRLQACRDRYLNEAEKRLLQRYLNEDFGDD